MGACIFWKMAFFLLETRFPKKLRMSGVYGMTQFEQFKLCLKQVLGAESFLTHFNIEGKEYDTAEMVSGAVVNLRQYIATGSWTKNSYQRFVMLNMCKTSEQIARAYSAKSYKASSTRTLRTDGVHRLMKMIPLEYLFSLCNGNPDSKHDFIMQRKASKYFAYLSGSNLTLNDFSVDYKKIYTQYIDLYLFHLCYKLWNHKHQHESA